MRTSPSTYLSQKSGLSPELSGAGLIIVLVTGLLLVAVMTVFNPAAALLAVIGLAIVLLGLRAPRWAAVVLVASLAVIPIEHSENLVFGYNIENPLQVLVPLVLALCLFGALKNRNLPQPILPDLLVVGLGLWGLASLLNGGDMLFDNYWRKYGNKLLFPMGFYLIVRLLPLDVRSTMRIIKVAAVFVVLQSILMVFEARGGGSPIYGDLHRNRPTGPFGYFWTAAAFLAMWPPLMVLVTSKAKSRLGWVIGFIGLLIVAYATTRTGQRGATFALLFTVPLCLLAPKMRKTAAAAIVAGMILYVPWSMTGSGGSLLSRFDETDESRSAYRMVAIELIKSPKWDPLFGIGPYTASRAMKGIDVSTDEEFFMHGRRTRTVAEVAEGGSALHNVYLALVVEFGGVGALLGGLAALCLLRSVIKLYRNPNADTALLIGSLGALVGWGGIGYLHNIYGFAAPMCLFYFFYGLIVGKPGAFFADGVEDTGADSDGRSADWRSRYLKPMRAATSRAPRDEAAAMQAVPEDNQLLLPENRAVM